MVIVSHGGPELPGSTLTQPPQFVRLLYPAAQYQKPLIKFAAGRAQNSDVPQLCSSDTRWPYPENAGTCPFFAAW